MSEQKVGLSLSLCISDVIAGQIREDEVYGIVAGTAAETPEAVDQLIEDYKREYWQDNPEAAGEFARRLFADGKVYQPRLDGHPTPRAVQVRWIDLEQC